MPTELQTETRRRIAQKIAYKYLDRTVGSIKLAVDIEAALKTEAEHCAMLAEESHPQPCTCTVCLIHAEAGAAIRRTIRNEDHK